MSDSLKQYALQVAQTLRSMEFFGQEYTEELYKKDLHDLGNHDGMITHLEPDILESEVK